jgi:hypothetical protein
MAARRTKACSALLATERVSLCSAEPLGPPYCNDAVGESCWPSDHAAALSVWGSASTQGSFFGVVQRRRARFLSGVSSHVGSCNCCQRHECIYKGTRTAHSSRFRGTKSSSSLKSGDKTVPERRESLLDEKGPSISCLSPTGLPGLLYSADECRPTTGESVGRGFRRTAGGAGDWSVWERKAAKLWTAMLANVEAFWRGGEV